MSAMLLAACLAIGAHAENRLYHRLLDPGLQPQQSDRSVQLPPPLLPDGLDAAAQQQVLEQLAQPNRRREDLLRNTVVAPFVLKTQQIAGGDEPLWQVGLWYVAYGSLDRIFQESFVAQLLELSGGQRRKGLPVSDAILTVAELQQRGVRAAAEEDLKERYHAGTIALFDRVLLSSTRQVMASRNEESILVAAAIDPRFDTDARYPNRWRVITRRTDGTFDLGPPQPYSVSAMYLKATRLKQPAGALFVEHQQVFAEPRGWFDGKNFLRSKLPLAVQDSVRDLRRQLAQKF